MACSCGSNCSDACTSCSGRGSCMWSCDGCKGCTGNCTGSCSGGCTGTCQTGCQGSCTNNCSTTCGGSCSGACNVGCTGQEQNTVAAALSRGVYAKADEVNALANLVVYEVKRRKDGNYLVADFTVGKEAWMTEINKVISNLGKLNKTVAAVPANTLMYGSKIDEMIDKALEAFAEVVDP